MLLETCYNFKKKKDKKMKLCDCESEVGHFEPGIYQYKNKKFRGWLVRFDVKNYHVDKSYVHNGTIIDDFEQINSDYVNLMAMIQSDDWEMKN